MFLVEPDERAHVDGYAATPQRLRDEVRVLAEELWVDHPQRMLTTRRRRAQVYVIYCSLTVNSTEISLSSKLVSLPVTTRLALTW